MSMNMDVDPVIPKETTENFVLSSVLHLVKMSARVLQAKSSPRERPNQQENQMAHPEARHTELWAAAGWCLWCHVYSVEKQGTTIKCLCLKYKVCLGIGLCCQTAHLVKENY
jgi:hypothetical protein